ncbi:MAG: hypothetical protein ABIA63_02385, partial [bacterium]
MKLFFISTGRCGTNRIVEILRKKLPQDYVVVHQMRWSRLANVIGNLQLKFNKLNFLKKYLYRFIISPLDVKNHFISADPLTSLIIPEEIIKDPNVKIVHIVRDEESFARSMLSFSRSNIKSFLAHGFVPFWQPGILPLENFIRSNILNKYKKACFYKNIFFADFYSA